MQKDIWHQRGIMEEKIIKKYMPLILKYSRLAPENDREDLGCFLPLFLAPSCSNFLTALRRNFTPVEEIKESEVNHGREKKRKPSSK